MKINFTKIAMFGIVLNICIGAMANNVTVSNVELKNIDGTAKTATVEFDISWENSWRYSGNTGEMVALFIRTGGTGYTNGTYNITFTGGTFTTAATANITVAGGVITTINSFTAGVGYTSPPTGFTGAGSGTGGIFDPHIHSWWDATWVFVKYKIRGNWYHATLAANGHTAPAGSQIDVPADKVGAFFYRSAPGTGTFSNSNVQLNWDWSDEYSSEADLSINCIEEIKVFAIEMVYVPQCSFYVGDGLATQKQFQSGNSGTPLLISSENSLTLGGTTAGNLGNSNNSGSDPCGIYSHVADDFNNTTTQTLPAAFPKGYKAFYCMKYYITQKEYVDFLNLLPRNQQNNLTATNLAPGVTSVTNRYVIFNSSTFSTAYNSGIRCDATIPAYDPITFYCDRDGDGIPNESNDGLFTVMGTYPNSHFRNAYLDWVGLRMMTELEYEKACRGPMTPIPNEWSWGTTTIDRPTSFVNEGQATEAVLPLTAKVPYDVCGGGWPIGNLRVGAVAQGKTGRNNTAQSYYGIFDLSGSNGDIIATVGVGTSAQRAYDAQHGDGKLSINGYANVTNWPGMLNGENTKQDAIVTLRGCLFGSYNPQRVHGISSRSHANFANWYGHPLGVRTAE